MNETTIAIVAAATLVTLACALWALRQRALHLRLARTEARTDDLTGLGNRRRWRELHELLQHERRAFSFVLFDVANLKAMNTHLGAATADKYLAGIGALAREGEINFDRIGGDEFMVTLPGCGWQEALKVRDRLEEAAGSTMVWPGVSTFLVGGIGEWRTGHDMEAQIRIAETTLSVRKAERKAALGMPLTRQETLDTRPIA